MRFDRIALRSRPVLVVSRADNKRVALQSGRIIREIARHRVLQLEARALGPLHETALVRVPACGTHVAGIAMLLAVLLIHRAVNIGLLVKWHGRTLAVVAFGVRPHEHAAPERPIERDAVSTRVKADPTPVVVRVVSVGRDDE